jgi:hypothetical protein
MNQDTLKSEARLLVIEYMIQRLLITAYASAKLSPEQIKQAHKNIREQMSKEEWPAPDPGQSALASGEVEDALDRFLKSFEAMLAERGLLPK